MVSYEEKQKFILELISICSLPEEQTKAQNLLHDMLMKDTQGGRLFKFRSVNDNSLDCLRNGTLYCPTPDLFNDPFDCKLGITFQSLYEAKYETELDLFQNVLEKFYCVYFGQVQIEDCSESEQRIIKSLFANQELMSFFNENRGKNPTLEEQNEIIRQNGHIVVALLSTVLSDESLRKSLGICSNLLPKLCDRIMADGSICFSDDKSGLKELAQSCGIDENLDEIETTLRISDTLFPENHDAVEKVDLLLETAEQNMIKKMNELFRIGCLATDFKNRLMWSHYADSHKGFCIEYDFSGTDEKTLQLLPLPVVYSEDRPLMPWKAAIDKSLDSLAVATQQMMLSLLTKDSAWSYENEWRILIRNSDDPLVKMPKISCIYLGALMREEDKKQITDIAVSQNIPVKQMGIDRGKYDLTVS